MATSMRADNKSLSAVNDALGIGAATIDVAYTGMNAAIDVVKEWARSSLPPASAASTRRRSVGIDELQNQLRSIAKVRRLPARTGSALTAVPLPIIGSLGCRLVRPQRRRQRLAGGRRHAEDRRRQQLPARANTDGAGDVADSGSAAANELGILGSARLRVRSDTALRLAVRSTRPARLSSSTTMTRTRPSPAEIDITDADESDIEDYFRPLTPP